MGVLTITVQPRETVLEYRTGTLTRVLGPGRHRRRFRARYERTDLRMRLTSTAPQEVLTADGVSLRATCAVRWSVSDAQVFHESAEDPFALVYLAAQMALREQLAALEVASVVRTARGDLAAAITAATAVAGQEVGVAVHDVTVKDVILPAELRAAYAEQVGARERGKAKLEAARAETAALRSLANAAKLLDESPALAQLRLVESLPAGSQVVLGDVRR